MAPTPVLLPGESQGRRSLVGRSPWGHCESDTTERLPFHFSLSCIGEGHGSPLQCSCLEDPRDGGAWWAAACGAAQGRARLTRLGSSGSGGGGGGGSAQLSPALCDPVDRSPPGSSVPGILQAGALEWVPLPSPGVFPTGDWTCVSCLSCIGRWLLYH